jgi:uncharacterized membrane protein
MIKSKAKDFFSHEKVKNFIKKSFIGGLIVVIPIAAIFAIFSWLWSVTVGIIHPITSIVSDKSGFGMLFSEIISIVAIIVACFFIGVFLTTTFGKWFHAKFDRLFAKLAPGYKMLKGVFEQLLSADGNSGFLSGKPVFVFYLGKNIPSTLTGFVSGRDKETGIVSVYCPIPMNPSSGIVYHVPEELVIEMENVDNEDVLKTIIGFGTGSDHLVRSTPKLAEAYKRIKEQ